MENETGNPAELMLATYRTMRLLHYRDMFGQVREKSGSLSATEAFSADVIFLLDRPTVGEFAAFLGISQPNASYKVAALTSKGYVERTDGDDRRQSRLKVTEKFLNYYGHTSPRLAETAITSAASFTQSEIAVVTRFLAQFNKQLASQL